MRHCRDLTMRDGRFPTLSHARLWRKATRERGDTLLVPSLDFMELFGDVDHLTWKIPFGNNKLSMLSHELIDDLHAHVPRSDRVKCF